MTKAGATPCRLWCERPSPGATEAPFVPPFLPARSAPSERGVERESRGDAVGVGGGGEGGGEGGGGGGGLQAARHMTMIGYVAKRGSEGSRGSLHAESQHAPALDAP